MFVTKEEILAARAKRDMQPWKSFEAELLEAADAMLTCSLPVSCRQKTQVLFRSRFFSRTAITLAGCYIYTGEEKYAKRAWDFIEDCLSWESWCAEPSGNNSSVQVDLSVGELAFTFSNLLYLLEDYLTQQQKKRLYDSIQERIFLPYYRAVTNTQEEPWWYLTYINWNSVTNGGIYCLALLLQDQFEVAKKILPLAERALQVYVDALHKDGSCEEGIGYWLYGTVFLEYALITYENITGRKHPYFENPLLSKTLDFPFDFSPNSVGISFGDVNWFRVTGALYKLMDRVGRNDLSHELSRRLLEYRAQFDKHPIYVYESSYMWAHEIFALAFCKEEYEERQEQRFKGLKVYPVNGWGLFTNGDMSLSFRSGSSDVNHGCRDLNAIALAKRKSRIIDNVSNHPYPLGWFGVTRKQFVEDSTASKSSQLVNGIGQLNYGEASFEYDSISMSSEAGPVYPAFMKSVKRTVSLFEDGFKLQDDFVNTDQSGSSRCWHEIRFFTQGSITQLGETLWRFEVDGESVTLQFDCSQELFFAVAQSIPSIPVNKPLNMLRVTTKEYSIQTSIVTTIR